MEAQVFAGKAARKARLEARNKNKRGKPILVGRKERNVSRDKRKIGKLEAVIQSGRATRVKVDALDKLSSSVGLSPAFRGYPVVKHTQKDTPVAL
jgi:hypothetical protein